MYVVCLDVEGVLLPEIWINVANRMGIDELRLTTRDIPDYDVLMKKRIDILDKHGIKIGDIQDVISTMEPLEGAKDFLDEIRSKTQVFLLSDTFTQFATPLMKKLGYPTLLCNYLNIDETGRISGYRLRQKDGKRKAVIALKSINYKIVAAGDSYNDITMLNEADFGILFKPPQNVIDEHPHFPVVTEYDTFLKTLAPYLKGAPLV